MSNRFFLIKYRVKGINKFHTEIFESTSLLGKKLDPLEMKEELVRTYRSSGMTITDVEIIALPEKTTKKEEK